MGILYPKFPTVDRPPDPIHVSYPLSHCTLSSGDELVSFRCIDPRLIGIAYQDRERLGYGTALIIPREDLTRFIDMLNDARLQSEELVS